MAATHGQTLQPTEKPTQLNGIRTKPKADERLSVFARFCLRKDSISSAQLDVRDLYSTQK